MSGPTPMELRAAMTLCKQHATACNVNRDDLWKLHSDDFLRDAKEVLEAVGALDLLVALRNARDFVQGFHGDDVQEGIQGMLDSYDAAIAKAEGANR